ncbi:MAG TPA: alpha/beta fold hydrolase [Terrimicrobiaceae bacterium]|nr:alpha/beta fold hydrolase [Terrimicrobiaceae bacterium]
MKPRNGCSKGLIVAVAVLLLGGNGGAERPAHARVVRTPVVLVHGYGDSGKSFAFFASKLSERGFECFAPDLQPADAGAGIEDVARKLKTEIARRYGADSPVAIVAFSMGGIVARYYLQKLGGAARCRAFFTVSSPHHGTLAAYLADGRGAVQMRPGSSFLRGLNADVSGYRRLEPVSYWTPLDLMIFPAASSIWRAAENVMVWELCHPRMLGSSGVIVDIIRRLDRAACTGADG